MTMKGFTLAEGLISTLMFGTIVALIFSFLGPTNKASNRARIESELSNQAQMAISRFARDAQGASQLENATNDAVTLKLPKYAVNGDLLDGQWDSITYRVLNRTLTYSRGNILDQVLLKDLEVGVVPFRYFGADFTETSPSNARLLRISLAVARTYGGQSLSIRQTRDVRLRNAR